MPMKAWPIAALSASASAPPAKGNAVYPYDGRADQNDDDIADETDCGQVKDFRRWGLGRPYCS
jgi:hypothetical protein